MIQKVLEPAKGKVYSVSFEGKRKKAKFYVKDNTVFLEDKPIYDTQEPRKLVGDYILNNMMFILGVSEILGVRFKENS